MSFSDTVRFSIQSGTGSIGTTLSTAELLPSLDINSVQERVIVVEEVLLEVMPNNFADQQLFQLRSSTFNTASEAFRLASSINPTKFRLNFRTLARMAPAIMFPLPVSSDADVVRLQAYSDADTFECSGRITTRVRLFPQRSLLTTVPLTFPVPVERYVPKVRTPEITFPSFPMGESPPPPADATVHGEAGHGGPNDLGNKLGHAHCSAASAANGSMVTTRA